MTQPVPLEPTIPPDILRQIYALDCADLVWDVSVRHVLTRVARYVNGRYPISVDGEKFTVTVVNRKITDVIYHPDGGS